MRTTRVGFADTNTVLCIGTGIFNFTSLPTIFIIFYFFFFIDNLKNFIPEALELTEHYISDVLKLDTFSFVFNIIFTTSVKSFFFFNVLVFYEREE